MALPVLVYVYLQQGMNYTQRNVSNLSLYCFGSSQEGNHGLGRGVPALLVPRAIVAGQRWCSAVRGASIESHHRWLLK